MSGPLLQADGLVKHFAVRGGLSLGGPRKVVRAVDGVSLAVQRGETLALVGESGCGKSTLGRLMLRLIEPTAGRIRFDGVDITGLGDAAMRGFRRRLQIIFQDPYSSLNPRMTVAEILGEPMLVHGIARGTELADRVAELLGLVGLAPAHGRRYPHEFSGGQRQRVGIARALASGPELVVGDEPVSALDVSIQAQIINLLQDLQRRLGLTLVVVAHDLAVVKHMADRVAVMYLGRIVEQGATETLFASPRHPYTRALLAAIPRPDPAERGARLVLEGDVPSPVNPPPGCHFHTRCPVAVARCAAEPPVLESDGGGGAVACHRWRELDPVPARPPAAPSLADRRLALYSAWRAHQDRSSQATEQGD
ncbi:MAG: dipeptide ABC transporter ATP-binding protein [Thalassobaculales bacterium]